MPPNGPAAADNRATGPTIPPADATIPSAGPTIPPADLLIPSSGPTIPPDDASIVPRNTRVAVPDDSVGRAALPMVIDHGEYPAPWRGTFPMSSLST